MPTAAGAQTTGAVFGPEVEPGVREIGYRLAFAFESGADDARIRHRLHYHAALNDRLRWRAIVSANDPVGGPLELNHVQGELLWQVVERTPGGFSSAFRFDARLSEGDDTPHEIGLNWTNQWVLNARWRARGLVLLDRDVGPNADEDWIVETRASVSRSWANGARLGLENFSEFGGVDAGFGGFDEQSHQIGPVLTVNLTPTVKGSAGVLFGVSAAAPDRDVMLRLSRSL